MVSGSFALAFSLNSTLIWKSSSYTDSGLASPATFSTLPSGYLMVVTLTPGVGASVSTVGMKFGSDGLFDCTCQFFSSFTWTTATTSPPAFASPWISTLSRLAASPGFFWASAAATANDDASNASGRTDLFILGWICVLRFWFKEKLFCHRPVGGDESLVAADQRIDISIPHPLRRVRGQRGTISAAAIHDDFCFGVRNHLLQVAFENALAEVNRPLGVASVPFMVLAHIHQDRLGIAGQPFARVVHGDLFYARARFVYQPQESGRVLHEPQNNPGHNSVNRIFEQACC